MQPVSMEPQLGTLLQTLPHVLRANWSSKSSTDRVTKHLARELRVSQRGARVRQRRARVL